MTAVYIFISSHSSFVACGLGRMSLGPKASGPGQQGTVGSVLRSFGCLLVTWSGIH